MKWEPEDYHDDPTVNALLNIAHAMHRQADATGELLYGLKYSKSEGMSIAEAIEKSISEGAESIAGALSGLSNAVEESDLNTNLANIAEAAQDIHGMLENSDGGSLLADIANEISHK